MIFNKELVFVLIVIVAFIAWIVYKVFFGRTKDTEIIRREAIEGIKKLHDTDVGTLQDLYESDIARIKDMGDEELLAWKERMNSKNENETEEGIDEKSS